MKDRTIAMIYWIDRIVKIVATGSIIGGIATIIILALTGNLHPIEV